LVVLVQQELHGFGSGVRGYVGAVSGAPGGWFQEHGGRPQIQQAACLLAGGGGTILVGPHCADVGVEVRLQQSDRRRIDTRHDRTILLGLRLLQPAYSTRWIVCVGTPAR